MSEHDRQSSLETAKPGTGEADYRAVTEQPLDHMLDSIGYDIETLRRDLLRIGGVPSR